MDAAAQVINAGLGRKEEDHIGCDLEGFHDDLIESGMEIGHEDILVFGVVMELC